MAERTETITGELYDAFQRVEFDRWDALIADNVLPGRRLRTCGDRSAARSLPPKR
jgi:hypothetical protein